jgi:hypothetical protein
MRQRGHGKLLVTPRVKDMIDLSVKFWRISFLLPVRNLLFFKISHKNQYQRENVPLHPVAAPNPATVLRVLFDRFEEVVERLVPNSSFEVCPGGFFLFLLDLVQ